MLGVILDACGTLNLYASGQFVQVLSALNNSWYIPAAAERETQRYRQPDPDDPDKLIVRPIDLTPAIESGLITRCDCESDVETELYVKLAAEIGDDGESMGLAIAKSRGWAVLTDDKKARRIAKKMDIAVLATTEVMKQWYEIVKPQATELSGVLEAIEKFGNFHPGIGDENYEWWRASIYAK